MAKLCTCGHARNLHKSGKGACLMCSRCLAYAAHRPPADDGAQVEIFEEGRAHARARIFDAVRAARTSARAGLTFEEVAKVTGLNVNTVRGRLSELRAEGAIREAQFKRKVGSGARAVVYCLAEAKPAASDPPHSVACSSFNARSSACNCPTFELRELPDGRRVAVEVARG